MKKLLLFSGILVCLFLVFRKTKVLQIPLNLVTTPSLINKEGNQIHSRVKIPEGYFRDSTNLNSFQQYLLNYNLKPFGAKVINYDGELYMFQQGHVGVLEIPVPTNGLQQCADALMRIRSEYLWEQNRKSEIGFKFTSGHYCSWKKYSEGYRPKIKGNKVSFHKTASKNISKTNFYKYLNLIYTYAGTLSMYNELTKIKVKKIQIGDMVVTPGTPGTPGHIIMVVDKITNKKGENLYLLAQGNTPAQSVHILKNTNDSSINPWYKIEENKRLETPIYWFEDPKFIRFKN